MIMSTLPCGSQLAEDLFVGQGPVRNRVGGECTSLCRLMLMVSSQVGIWMGHSPSVGALRIES